MEITNSVFENIILNEGIFSKKAVSSTNLTIKNSKFIMMDLTCKIYKRPHLGSLRLDRSS